MSTPKLTGTAQADSQSIRIAAPLTMERSLFARLLTGWWPRRIVLEKTAIRFEGGHATSISLMDLSKAPELRMGVYWTTLSIAGLGRTTDIRGLSRSQTIAFAEEVAKAATQHQMQTFKGKIVAIRRGLERLDETASARYLRQSTFGAWLREWQSLELPAPSKMLEDALNPQDRALVRRMRAIYVDPEQERERLVEAFVAQEFVQRREFLDTVESRPLTERQRLACIRDDDANLVLAGAGCGKTSVIVGKAGLLLESGAAKPEEILILAYNRLAAKDTQRRIDERLAHQKGITAKTFHALGLEIIGQATGTRPSVSDLVEDEMIFASKIAEWIKELLKHPGWRKSFDSFVCSHATPYRYPFEFGTLGDYLAYLQEHDSLRTLRGDKVRSQEERQIADFLYLNGVDYFYERPYEHPTANARYAQYKPDFYLPAFGIYLEHFAIDEQGHTPRFIDQDKYLEGMAWKRELHQTHGTHLVESYSYWARDGALLDHLEDLLTREGVTFCPVPASMYLDLDNEADQEADEEADEEADVEIERRDRKRKPKTFFQKFVELIKRFLSLFKSSGRTPDELLKAATKKSDAPRACAFLELFDPVLRRYERELTDTGTIDFDDMILEATRLVQTGAATPRYRYVLVDEFQDISRARARFVRALVAAVPDSSLFCVGDDWQAIYRFAGSEVALIRDFPEHFGAASTTALDLTFRFHNQIERLASRFILKNPAQVTKDVGTLRQAGPDAICLVWHKQNMATAVRHCLDTIAEIAAPGARVMILGRYRHLQGKIDLTVLGKAFPSLNIDYRTIHASKGLEADHVIVIGLDQDRFGFPSQIASDPLLDLVLPDAEAFEHAEERRLFYVAVTRAKHQVYLVADMDKPSPFITELVVENGTTYHFVETSVGIGPENNYPIETCTSCRSGRMQLAVNRTTGDSYFRCSNYPACPETAPLCKRCNRAPYLRERDVVHCPACGHVEATCPKCDTGRLVERVNRRNGTIFWGCSNFARPVPRQCRHTTDHHPQIPKL